MDNCMKSKHNSDEDLSGSGLCVVSDQHAYREGASGFSGQLSM